MKVLQIHNCYRQAGGEDTVVDAEADALDSAGHTVARYFAENPTGPSTAGSLLRATWNTRSQSAIRMLVEREQPDVAHVHNTWFALSPSIFSAIRQAGVPVVWTSHNYRFACANALLLRDGIPCTMCVGGTPWPAIKYTCYRDPLSSFVAAATIARARRDSTYSLDVDVVLALTSFARDLMIESGIDAEKIFVKPNFTGDPGPRTVEAAASNTVLFVGRLSEEKGIGILMDAWRRLNTDLRLVVVGDGPEAAHVETQPGVEFRGRLGRDEVTSLMLASRALIFPSIWFEGQPMVLLEALAAGLPIIGSRLGALPELVEFDGFDGLVTPGNSIDLAARIASLDDSSAQSASSEARSRWSERFSPEVGIANLESVYLRAIQGST